MRMEDRSTLDAGEADANGWIAIAGSEDAGTCGLRDLGTAEDRLKEVERGNLGMLGSHAEDEAWTAGVWDLNGWIECRRWGADECWIIAKGS